jgi:putative sterol carrier protein
MNAKELLHRIPESFDASDMAENAVIQYAISEPVYHVLENGRLTAHDGEAEAPDVTIRVSDENLVRLMTGELNPMSAFMTGKLKLDGNVMLAQRLVARVDRASLVGLT